MNNEFRHVNTLKILVLEILSFLHAIGHQAPTYHTRMSRSYNTEADPNAGTSCNRMKRPFCRPCCVPSFEDWLDQAPLADHIQILENAKSQDGTPGHLEDDFLGRSIGSLKLLLLALALPLPLPFIFPLVWRWDSSSLSSVNSVRPRPSSSSYA